MADTARYATDADLTARYPFVQPNVPVVGDPGFSTEIREIALCDAEAMIEVAEFCQKALPAHVALAMHLLATEQPNAEEVLGAAEQGPITSLSAGAISAGFAVKGIDAGDNYSSTVWGRKYQLYCNGVASHPEAV